MYGLNEAEEIFGSLNLEGGKHPDQKIFEQAGDPGAIADFADKQMRSQAMACALAWVEQGDFSYQAMNDSVATIADLDGDGELTPDEDAYFNDLLSETAYAMTALGADATNVQNFFDNEDDDEGAKLGAYLSEQMNSVQDDDETLITNYAISNSPITESADGQIFEGFVKRVMGGKIVLKRKRIGRPHKMTAAQRAGMKVARRKAFTGAAKLHRAKSMRLRRKRGL
jgi:hypothetical protein